jgi:hypothetical protein
MKHSCPDIANPVRELLKALDGTNANALNEMKHAIKFILDTKGNGQKIEPRKPNDDSSWKLEVFRDSNLAVNKETRISMTWDTSSIYWTRQFLGSLKVSGILLC